MKIAMTCRNSFALGTLMLAAIGLTACQDVTSPPSARGKVSTDVTTALGQLRRTLRAESANGTDVVILNNTHLLLNGRKVKMADHAVNRSHRERSRQCLDEYGTECYTHPMVDAAPRITAFVRLPMFVSSAKGLLDDEAERMIEQMLADDPEAGATIANSGGVRKMRVALPGRGKRGGARLIYFHRPSAGRI